MAAMAAPEEHPVGSAGAASRLPTLPVSDGRGIVEAFVDKTGAAAASGASTDRLPVVELRPFMNQEWRPSRSVPDFYDRSFILGSARRKSDVSSGYPDPASLGLINQKANEFGSRNSLVNERREAGRIRPREGKPVDTSHAGVFISTVDREKTTMDEMRATAVDGGGPCTQTASIVRSLSEGEMLRMREMRVQGRRVENLPPKLSMIYMTPWEYYRIHRPYQIPIPDKMNGEGQNATAIMDDLEQRYQVLENVHIDDNIYDTFDRSNTLPSIQVTNAPTRRKRPRQRQLSATSSSAPGSGKTPAYRLGVANSLDVLRHYGKPARVETHLTTHLKHTLSQLRRSQDPQTTLQGLTSAGVPLPGMTGGRPMGLRTSGTPTYGETMIRAGIEANNTKQISERNIRAAMPSKSAPDVLSRPATHVKNEIYRHESTLDGDATYRDEPKSSRVRVKSRGGSEFLELETEPKTRPSSVDYSDKNPSDSVADTPSRRSKHPQDLTSPQDPTPTKSPRSKSRREKSKRRGGKTDGTSSEVRSAETTSSSRRTPGDSRVDFKDRKQGDEEPKMTPRTPREGHRDEQSKRGTPMEGGATPKPRSRGSMTPAVSAQLEGQAEVTTDGQGDIQDDLVKSPPHSAHDFASDIEVTPAGDIRINGSTVGAIEVGPHGEVIIGGTSVGIIKVSLQGDIQIKSLTPDSNTEDNLVRISTNNGDGPVPDLDGDVEMVKDSGKKMKVDNTVKTEAQPSGDIGSKVMHEPTGDVAIGAAQEPTGDTVTSDSMQEPNGDIINEAVYEPTGDIVSEAMHEPTGDIASEAMHDTTGDMMADPKTKPTSDNTAEPMDDTNTNLEGDIETPVGDIEDKHDGDNNTEGTIDISGISLGPDGHLRIGDKDMGVIEFGRQGEIKMGGKTVGAIAVTPNGDITLRMPVNDTEGCSLSGSEDARGNNLNATPSSEQRPVTENAGAPQEGTPGEGGETGLSGEAVIGVTEDSDVNNNHSDATHPGRTKTPAAGTPDPSGARPPGGASGSDSTPDHPESETVSPPRGEAEPTVPMNDVTPGDRKAQTKSAASKTSSNGYQGDAVYLTSWDQKTECESVRPETVLTVREEGE